MDAAAIVGAVTAVTKKWAKVRKAEERQESRRSRREEEMCRSRRVTIKEAAWDVMQEAYLKVSGGKLPAMATQVMYAARGQVLSLTGCQTLDRQYFNQQLLPDYMTEHPDETARWDVVFDARGHFEEPHTQRSVALGTVQVRDYLTCVSSHVANGPAATFAHSKAFPTCGPNHRFGAILFIEKEGFLPLFRAVRLAERYDIAVMSTKGISVTASRALIDELCETRSGVPLLVLHDFDKSGFTILATLQRDTRRYEFHNDVRVIDLGLRLQDVKAYHLESEDVYYGKSNPTWNLRENGATKAEIAFLCEGGDSWHGYRGKRVELNAFTSGDFVGWIEGKLKEHGIKKVVPDDDCLEIAYRRALQVKLLQAQLKEFHAQARQQAATATVPKQLAGRIRKRLRADPALAWDQALMEFV